MRKFSPILSDHMAFPFLLPATTYSKALHSTRSNKLLTLMANQPSIHDDALDLWEAAAEVFQINT